MARERLVAGDTENAINQIDQLLGELAPDRLVTTREAADLLGVQSDLVVKLCCRHGELKCASNGDAFLVPLAEVESFAGSEQVRKIRIADQYHEASKELGEPEALSEEELAILSETRPGTLPWKRLGSWSIPSPIGRSRHHFTRSLIRVPQFRRAIGTSSIRQPLSQPAP